ncbi:L-lactate dehydrogenase [Lachancea thermotolerans CBS 6340]|uniref:L-lactate dehydrogenase n=1 Tax=Lachancea thermotolerans (strain ATCC 56472 / CBS 6340 / NRRL Y-8284) TaxID=559295 RepID=C5DFW3_LACTC|nr:KLTH0D00440p [Lachancea thermotolerans CBS 6340]CAR22305.1 KLTH0D00440p [Lachancea thermotolerans CBS 6340]
MAQNKESSTMKAGLNPVKVVVVGTGSVGSTTAYTLLLSGMVAEIVLIDINKDKADGEGMDLNHAAPMTTDCRVYVGDYPDCANAAIVIITGGANQKPGQTRMDLAAKNAKIMQEIIPNIVKNAPDTILLLATNPVDVLTSISYKLSGFPASRVIGSGTLLDSARLRYNLSKYYNISSESIGAFIIGEHGDSELPVWSLASIAGMRLRDYCEKSNQKFDQDALEKIFEKTRSAAYDIIKRKGYTAYGIAAGLVRIVETILKNEGSLLTVSTVGDYFGVKQVALSVPTKVDRTGAHHIVGLSLDDNEIEEVKKSGQNIKSVCSRLGFD